MRSMQRKGFHNRQPHNHAKEHRQSGIPQYQRGTKTGLKDRFKQEIHIGDLVSFCTKDNVYYGRVFYNQEWREYVLAWGQWYGTNIYDLNSYGKAIIIPSDNGGRMQLEIIRNY